METKAKEEAARLAFPVEVDRQRAKYQVLRRLAIGGMAELFLARSTGIEGFEKLVVLKRILPQFATDGRFIRMFLQEARLAATLHHSNVGQVYDVGRDTSGAYFFAMEYIHGIDLRRVFHAAKGRAGQVPLEHVLTIIVGAAAGLHYAHEKQGEDGRPLGLVHRDVSPSNVLVGFNGMVKVVDFGIAKASDHRNETRPGTVKGKLAYMSPEQCAGERLDRRSDVFALGIVLYELTTGTYLFGGKNDVEIIKQVTEAHVPPPSTRVPGYPPGLERIVMRALKKVPSERYETALALQLELEDFAQEQRFHMSTTRLGRYLEERFGKEAGARPKAQPGDGDIEELMVSISEVTDEVSGSGVEEDERTGPSFHPVHASASQAANPAENLPVGLSAKPAPSAPELAAMVRVTKVIDAVPAEGGSAAVSSFLPKFKYKQWGLLSRVLVPSVVLVLLGFYVGGAYLGSRNRGMTALPEKVTKPGTPGQVASAVPSTAPVTPSAPAFTGPAVVRFDLVGLPKDAQLFFDDMPVEGTTIKTGKSDTVHRIRILARGYRPKVIEWVSLTDRLLSVELRPIRRSAANPQPAASKKAPQKRLDLTSPREL